MKRRKLIALGVILVLGISAVSYAQRRGGGRHVLRQASRAHHVDQRFHVLPARLSPGAMTATAAVGASITRAPI